MRAAVYLRVSTDKQDVRNSVARQIAACRAWAASHDVEIVDEHIYQDEEISGSTLARPGVQRIIHILTGAAPPPFDAVLIDDSSRLDRSGNLAALVRLFVDRDVKLIDMESGRDLTDEDEELLVHVKAGLDARDLKVIARRTRAGLAQRALRGFWTGGTVYGYRFTKTPDGTTIQIEPARAETVREIFRKRLAGAGYRDIAIALNETEHRSPRGGTWDATCIRAILRNPKYKGDWTWNVRHWKKLSATSILDPRRPARRVKTRPVSEHVRSIREDLRIIDDEAWAAVTDTFRPRAVGKQPVRSPVSGLARCICGGPIVRGGGVGRLTCGWAKNRGPKVCVNRRAVFEEDVLRSLRSYLTAKLLTPDRVTAFTAKVIRSIKKKNSLKSTATAREDLAARIARLEIEIGRLMAVLADGFQSTSVRTAVAEREAKLHFARQALQTLQLSSSAVMPAEPDKVRARVEEVVAGLGGAPTAVREALRAVAIEILVRDTDAGWSLQVKTRPWVLGAGGDNYPKGGSGGRI